MEYKIRRADKSDAPFLAETVMGALGEELCINLAAGKENIPLVRKLFTDLASDENSQYSYTNALVAFCETDPQCGAVIAYDGARLHPLRKAFIREANRTLEWNVKEEEEANWEDETNASEIYIDSLYVKPGYRGKGIASSLIAAVMTEFRETGKPFGILVEPENLHAKRLYEHLGFIENGVNRFCGVPMLHLVNRPANK